MRTTDETATTTTTSTTDDVFDLPPRLAAKADPALVADDARHLRRVEAALEHAVADVEARLDAARRERGGTGQGALDRDQEVHRLTSRLRTLRRFGLDVCLGRMVGGDGTTVHVGRLGLADADGERLLVDWRSPAAEPFFAATHADPHGLASRRRYRWDRGRVVDFWDEVFTPEGLEGHAALDDQSAFVASLGASRSARMRDVLGTIQADQDAVVRAGSEGALVVDGGPGTGKTVVALHRCAYLLHADRRVGRGRGGVLVVGPSRPYLGYVADVLPSLGEDGVRTCTLADLVPEGAGAAAETDPRVAALKADARMVDAVEPAVRLYEEPPTTTLVVDTDAGEVRVRPADWVEAFAAVDPATPHDEAQDELWAALAEILADRLEDVAADDLLRVLRADPDVVEAVDRAWTLVDPADLVADLWSVPAYLRHCAPWLDEEEVALLRRSDPYAWTDADLPLLDAARRRLGDPDASRRRRRREADLAARRAQVDRVVDDLITTARESGADAYDEGLVTMLRQPDLQDVLVDDAGVPVAAPDALAGPFAHVVVDEAQELTDAEWRMVLARCPSRSLTIVGDRAQARHGFDGTWEERLARVGIDRVRHATLTVGYRTPSEVMTAAEPVIRAALPDANVPTSVRSTGVPVQHRPLADLDDVVETWLREHAEGTACVVGAAVRDLPSSWTERVRSLAPSLAKGLEFDLVVLVRPDDLGPGLSGAVDRYVAMTRATHRLVVLT